MEKISKYWSGRVARKSNALDLEPRVFTWSDPKKIARSLKCSAEESVRRKAGPFQSAMSMLNFYINRAGKNLQPERKKVLKEAKKELRKLFKKGVLVHNKSKMSHKSKKVRSKLGGHLEPIDPLEEIEINTGSEFSGKMHALAEKPTKLTKKIRSNPRESYRPLHRK